ncbi:MAG: TolC family protein [Phycisphaerales bacterium]
MIRPALGTMTTFTVITSLLGCSDKWIDSRLGLDHDEDVIPIRPLDMTGGSMVPVSPESETSVSDSIPSLLSAGSAEVVLLGLDEFRESLIRNNLALNVARFDPTLASTRVLAEQSRLDTTLAANVLAAREMEDASANNLPIYALESNYRDAGVGLAIPLATGGEVWLEGDLYRYETAYLDGGSNVSPDSIAFPSNLNAAVTLPLLRGAGYDATLGPIAVAAYDERLAVLDLRVLLSRLLASSETVYWQLARSWRAVELQQRTLDEARSLVTDVEKLAAAGVVPAAQRYRAELTVNQRQAELLDADLILRRDMRSVKIIMNRDDVPLDQHVVVKPQAPLTLTAYTFDRAGLATMAFVNRTELVQAEYELRKDEQRIRMARNALLPELDVRGSVGLLGIGTSASGAIDSLLDGEFPPAWKIGLHLRMPLENRLATAEYQAAVIGRLQTLAKRREVMMMVAQEVYDAIDRLEIGWALVVATRKAASDAQRNLEAQRRLLQAGTTTVYEVSLAITDLGNAGLEVIDAETGYQVALIELAEATGTTLGRQAVEVLPHPIGNMDDAAER